MEDFGVIAYIVAAVVYTIYSSIRKSKKKKQQRGGKQTQPQKTKSPRQQQPQQPGKSLDEILKELYPETQQKQAPPQPESKPKPVSSSRPDLSQRVKEAKEILNDPSKRRLETKDIDWMPSVKENEDEAKINFDLRQAIIAKAILERPYK